MGTILKLKILFTGTKPIKIEIEMKDFLNSPTNWDGDNAGIDKNERLSKIGR